MNYEEALRAGGRPLTGGQRVDEDPFGIHPPIKEQPQAPSEQKVEKPKPLTYDEAMKAGGKPLSPYDQAIQAGGRPVNLDAAVGGQDFTEDALFGMPPHEFAKEQTDVAQLGAALATMPAALVGGGLVGFAGGVTPENVLGYTFREPTTEEWKYFKKNKQVTGMASFDDGKIVLNPYSGINARGREQEKAAVSVNEAVRLWMRETKTSPNFKITQEQMDMFKGTPYEGNEKAIKETLVGRWITGDPSGGYPNDEQLAFIKNIAPKLLQRQKYWGLGSGKSMEWPKEFQKERALRKMEEFQEKVSVPLPEGPIGKAAETIFKFLFQGYGMGLSGAAFAKGAQQIGRESIVGGDINVPSLEEPVVRPEWDTSQWPLDVHSKGVLDTMAVEPSDWVMTGDIQAAMLEDANLLARSPEVAALMGGVGEAAAMVAVGSAIHKGYGRSGGRPPTMADILEILRETEPKALPPPRALARAEGPGPLVGPVERGGTKALPPPAADWRTVPDMRDVEIPRETEALPTREPKPLHGGGPGVHEGGFFVPTEAIPVQGRPSFLMSDASGRVVAGPRRPYELPVTRELRAIPEQGTGFGVSDRPGGAGDIFRPEQPKVEPAAPPQKNGGPMEGATIPEVDAYYRSATDNLNKQIKGHLPNAPEESIRYMGTTIPTKNMPGLPIFQDDYWTGGSFTLQRKASGEWETPHEALVRNRAKFEGIVLAEPHTMTLEEFGKMPPISDPSSPMRMFVRPGLKVVRRAAEKNLLTRDEFFSDPDATTHLGVYENLANKGEWPTGVPLEDAESIWFVNEEPIPSVSGKNTRNIHEALVRQAAEKGKEIPPRVKRGYPKLFEHLKMKLKDEGGWIRLRAEELKKDMATKFDEELAKNSTRDLEPNETYWLAQDGRAAPLGLWQGKNVRGVEGGEHHFQFTNRIVHGENWMTAGPDKVFLSNEAFGDATGAVRMHVGYYGVTIEVFKPLTQAQIRTIKRFVDKQRGMEKQPWDQAINVTWEQSVDAWPGAAAIGGVAHGNEIPTLLSQLGNPKGVPRTRGSKLFERLRNKEGYLRIKYDPEVANSYKQEVADRMKIRRRFKDDPYVFNPTPTRRLVSKHGDMETYWLGEDGWAIPLNEEHVDAALRHLPEDVWPGAFIKRGEKVLDPVAVFGRKTGSIRLGASKDGGYVEIFRKPTDEQLRTLETMFRDAWNPEDTSVTWETVGSVSREPWGDPGSRPFAEMTAKEWKRFERGGGHGTWTSLRNFREFWQRAKKSRLFDEGGFLRIQPSKARGPFTRENIERTKEVARKAGGPKYERAKTAWREFWRPWSSIGENYKDYLYQRGEFFGDLWRAGQFVDKIFKDLSKYPEGVRRDFFYHMADPLGPEYIDGIYRKTGARVMSDELVKKAERLRRISNWVGRMAVRRGLISEETFNEMKDSYIHYMYLKHHLPDADFTGMGGAKMNMGTFKRRNPNMTMEQRQAIELIDDVATALPTGLGKTLGDVFKWDYFTKLAEDPVITWQPARVVVDHKVGKDGKSYPVKMGIGELQKEIETFQKMAAEKPGEVLNTMAQERYRKLVQAMEQVKDISGNAPSNFKQMPVSEKYGKLSGAFVRTPVWDDIVPLVQNLYDDPSRFHVKLAKGFEATTTAFKIGKVPLNPPTVIRNMISNMIQMNMSGIPFWEVPGVVMRGIESYRKGDHFYTRGSRSGLTNTNWTIAELGEVYDAFASLNKGKGFWPKDVALKLVKFYGKIDDIAKISLYRDAVTRRGMSHAEAIVLAQEYGMDYSLAPRGVKGARRTLLPFVSYQYKIAPLLWDTMTKRPWVIAKFALIPFAMIYGPWFGAKSRFNWTEDDVKRAQKELAQRTRDVTGNYVIIPHKDNKGNLEFTNLEYFFPWGNWQSFLRDLKDFDLDAKEALAIGGAWANMLHFWTSRQRGNTPPTDPFSGMPIYSRFDDTQTKMAKFAWWTMKLWMPGSMTEYGALGHTVRAGLGKTDRWGRKATPGNAILRWFGVNVGSIDRRQMKMIRRAKEYEAQRDRFRQKVGKTREEQREIDRKFMELRRRIRRGLE
jgi:hypothetical protein